jgi:hypothetical protein
MCSHCFVRMLVTVANVALLNLTSHACDLRRMLCCSDRSVLLASLHCVYTATTPTTRCRYAGGCRPYINNATGLLEGSINETFTYRGPAGYVDLGCNAATGANEPCPTAYGVYERDAIIYGDDQYVVLCLFLSPCAKKREEMSDEMVVVIVVVKLGGKERRDGGGDSGGEVGREGATRWWW